MPWKLPTGHRDPYGDWDSPESAYDGDIATKASPTDLGWGGYSHYLHLTIEPTYTSQIRVFFYLPTPEAQGRISIDKDNHWIDPPWGAIIGGTDWYRLTFEPQWVDEFVVQMYPAGAELAECGVASCLVLTGCGECPDDAGPLAEFCNDLFGICQFWLDLGQDIVGVPIVGDYLAQPFIAVSDLFNTLAVACCEFSEWLQDVLDVLSEGVTWEAILTLIQEHAPDLYVLITDPVNWVLVKLTLAFDLEPWHTQSLEFLAKWVLEAYFPGLYAFWLDPGAWIAENILPLIPELPDWLADPDGWLIEALGRLFPGLVEFLDDPIGWIKNQVLEILADIYEELRAFLDNAWDWLLDRYEDAFEGISDKLYALAERTIRYFWEGIWQE